MNSKNKQSFNNAEDVIERFGGIRPMSTKTGIPVTTIQGWKKRDSIPATRTSEIVKAAEQNEITIQDLIATQGAKAVTPKPEKPVSLEKAAPEAKASQPDASSVPSSIAPPAEAAAPERPITDTLEERFAKVEQSAITKSAMISVMIVILVLGALTLLLLPKAEEVDAKLDANGDQISALEGQVDDMREGGSFMGGLIPQEWKDQLGEYTQQATELKEQALAAKGLSTLRVGRFLHVLGDTDKGKALIAIKAVYRQAGSNVVAIALGDGDNDIAMLQAADYPVLIRSPAHALPELITTKPVIISDETGPAGWADSIKGLLKTF
jgi:hypothetical protein